MTLNEKIAKWCGLKKHRSFVKDMIYWTIPPSDLVIHYGEDAPNFTTSFDVCLKYIVPKLVDIEIHYPHNGLPEYWVLLNCKYSDTHKELPMAFCLALERYITTGWKVNKLPIRKEIHKIGNIES